MSAASKVNVQDAPAVEGNSTTSQVMPTGESMETLAHHGIEVEGEDSTSSQPVVGGDFMGRIIATASTLPIPMPIGVNNLPDQAAGRSESTASSTSCQSDDGEPATGLPATLWCPNQGRNHGSLIEWMVFTCPFCKQHLGPPVTNAISSRGSVISRTNSTERGSDVRYLNHFLDVKNDLITVGPWDGLLDLEKARGNLARSYNSTLEVITEIKTSFDPYRPGRFVRDPTAQEMLDNPEYRMEVKKRLIRIVSRRIIEALTRMVTYYPGVSLLGDQVKIEEPYCIIFHHMENIEEFQSTYSSSGERPLAETDHSCDEVTHHHLDVLKSTVMQFFGEDVRQEKARYRQPIPHATFKMLWLLYKPGTTVYTELDGGMQACVIRSVEFSHKSTSKLKTPYCLSMWYMNFDGHRLGRCECTRYIGPFEGEREITSLRVYPCTFLDMRDDGLTRKTLEARGEKFYRFLSGAQVEYHGESLGNPARRVRNRAKVSSSKTGVNFCYSMMAVS